MHTGMHCMTGFDALVLTSVMTKTLVACGSLNLKSRFTRLLQNFQVSVDFTFSQKRAYQLLQSNNYHLAIVDQHLRGGGSSELVDFLHSSFYNTHVLAIIRRINTQEKIEFLKKGADECLWAGSPDLELKIKVSRFLSSYKLHQPNILQLNDITISTHQGAVSVGEKPIRLRKKEIQILEYLFKHKNTVVSRKKIINAIWPQHEPRTTTIDCYIKRIRSVLGKRYDCITTVWGFGYMVKER